MDPALDEFRTAFIGGFQRIGMNTTPEDARLLRILIESSGATRGLEIGTATGYGALVMGLGFERTAGRLTSVDRDAEMVRTAQANIRQMRLEDVVTVMDGAALEVIPRLDGPFDFVFIDAAKEEYMKYFRAVEPQLAAKAIVVADNVIKYADAMRDFLDCVSSDPRYQMVVVRASDEKGDGMAVIYKDHQ
jgi:predicted O-methyltransferase YrrM